MKLVRATIPFFAAFLLALLLLICGVSFGDVADFEVGKYPDTGTSYVGVPMKVNVPFKSVEWSAHLEPRSAKHWRIEQVECYSDMQRKKPIGRLRNNSMRDKPDGTRGGFVSLEANTPAILFISLELTSGKKPPLEWLERDLVLRLIGDPQ